MHTQEPFLPSNATLVRDFRVVLLWPMRLEPAGNLRKDREDGNKGACEWIHGYAKWITEKVKEGENESPWKVIPDYYRDSGHQTELPSEQRYAEFLYFHPFIQRCFYAKSGAAPIAILKRTDIAAARIQLRTEDVTWSCAVDRVNLFLFPSDVAIAVVQLGMPQSETPARDFLLSDALDFLDWVRRVYPPYFDKDKKPGGVPAHMEWLPAGIGRTSNFRNVDDYIRTTCDARVTPVASHWQALMEPLSASPGADSQDGLRYSQLEDDRVPLFAYIAVGDPARITPQDWVRLAFCDCHADSAKWPYSSVFLKDFEREHCYDRFWDPPNGHTTRYMITGYSFLAVGRSGDSFFDELVRNHTLQIYSLLGLLAHLQKASLLGFWKRLADMVYRFEQEAATPDSKKKLFKEQEWLLQDLTDFVSRFYFREVSNQLQAIEFFDLMSKHLRIHTLFADVVQQSEFVRKVLYEERQHQFSQLAYLGLPVGLAATLLGLSIGLSALEKAFYDGIGKSLHLSKWGSGMLLSAVTLAALWWVLHMLFQRWQRGSKP